VAVGHEEIDLAGNCESKVPCCVCLQLRDVRNPFCGRDGLGGAFQFAGISIGRASGSSSTSRGSRIEAAQSRWRSVNAPHFVALVRAGAKFEKGVLIERTATKDQEAAA
jgi:hypothetical protein